MDFLHYPLCDAADMDGFFALPPSQGRRAADMDLQTWIFSGRRAADMDLQTWIFRRQKRKKRRFGRFWPTWRASPACIIA